MVSERSTVTAVSIAAPEWSMPRTRSVSRGSAGSGRNRYSLGALPGTGDILDLRFGRHARRDAPGRQFMSFTSPRKAGRGRRVPLAMRDPRSCSLALARVLRVDLGPDQDDDGRDPDPGHEGDRGAERSVSLVVAAEIRSVPGKQQRRADPQQGRGGAAP